MEVQLKETKEGEEKVIMLPRSSVAPYVPQDISVQYLDKIARNFIAGNESVSHSRDVRRDLEEKVVKRIGKKGKYMVDKIFELIEGIYVVDNVAGKAVRYYKTPPNLSAIIYALDRVLGKPKQTVDKTEEKRGVFVVEHIIKSLAEGGGGKVEGDNLNNQKNGNGERIGAAVGVGGGIRVDLGGEVAGSVGGESVTVREPAGAAA